jgi:predicted NUDIX family NTP pyrophosphohydrolase
MAKRSAALLLYRRVSRDIEVLLVHPGGPYWRRKDDGAWSIPKGEHNEGEDALSAARREFQEETGARAQGEAVPLGDFRQSSAKTISVWAVEGDFDPGKLVSITFEMEWPPRSKRMQTFPEVDGAAWFGREEAARKILKGQRPALEALYQRLASGAKA